MFHKNTETVQFGSQTFQKNTETLQEFIESFQSKTETFQKNIENFQKFIETVQEFIENLGKFPQKWVKMTHFEVLDIFKRAIFIEYARGGNATPKHYFKCRRHKIVQ